VELSRSLTRLAERIATHLGLPAAWGRLSLTAVTGGVPGALLGIAFALVAPKHYEATAQIAIDAPSQLGALGNLAGLAAQFGVPTASGSSPFYFAALGSNTDVLERVLTIPIAARDSTLHLIDLYRPGLRDQPALRLQRAMRDLSQDVSVSTDIKSGLVTVTVTQPDPVLAVAVTDSLVSAMDLVGRQRLHSRARAEREYTEVGLDSARRELTRVEDDLESFYNANRTIEGSPRLKLAESRLLREADLRRSVVVSLQQNLESARLDEIRSTPLLTVVQHPLVPGKPSWPKKSVLAILGFGVGALLWLALGRGRELPPALS
jgi:uncharacterized protein involved in exopolysaccharide biosynthesis